MSYRFEMSNVKDSFTQLYSYVARIVGESAWKNDPIILDQPLETWVKFSNPVATVKEVKANTEPFFTIGVHLAKPYAQQLNVVFVSDNKKSTARFRDMLHQRNRSVADDFFAMVQKMDGFSFKIQIKNSFKSLSVPKYEDVLIVPANSVTIESVVESVKTVTETCESTRMLEEGKLPTYRGLSVSICKDFTMDEMALDESPFDRAITLMHEFMSAESKIVSDKDVAKTVKDRKKIEGKIKFNTIVSNRADKQFYSRLSKAEFERMTETYGVQVWDIESFEEKKYIRGALKVVSEL